MTDAIRELFELLAKKENTGSDYTGTITRVEGKTAYVRFNGSDITDTPVALSIGASEGDTVRVRVADGRAWLVGNDTAPPNDSSGVAYDLIRTNAYIRQLTTERIYGENGWINLLTGTFDYGNGALSWNGDHLTVKGAITATSGQIGPWNITSSAIYKVSSTWGSSTAGAAYFGNSGISITDKFKVNASGELTATGANITGVVTATSGELGGWTLTSTQLTAKANNANTGNVERTTGLQIPGNGIWAIAVGATNPSSWATAPFRVNHKGELYATGATISGTITSTDATITGNITATTGSIGGFRIVNTSNNGTTANGGHCYGTGMYAQASDSTYEYEAGMKGDSGSPNYLAFYIGRIAKGAAWSTNTKVFSIANNGLLTSTNADITGKVTATSGKIGPWVIDSYGISIADSSFTSLVRSNYISLSANGGAYTTIANSGIQTISGNNSYVQNASSITLTGTSEAIVNVYRTGGRTGRLVANNNNFGLYDTAGNGQWVFRSGNDGNTYIAGTLYCNGYEGSTGYVPALSQSTAGNHVGIIAAEATRLRIRGQWGGTSLTAKDFNWSGSDIRMKTDINKTKVNALNVLKQIDMCEFKMQGVYHPIGMVADWIEELDPLLTSGGGYDEDGSIHWKSVDTFYLMGYVVKAIQELADKIEGRNTK